jgi:SAM-dependent methyltransferase
MVEQVAYWNGPAGERWAKEQTDLDAMLRPFGEAVLGAARVTSDERVLDVGCGCGDTSLTLASLVGPGGHVLGVDVSRPMLERAKARGGGIAQLAFRLADAATEPVGPGAFDLLVSRFGVMFFPDPLRAFTHLRTALRAGGRMAFVCWRPLADNPWATVPFEAAARVLGRPEPEPPDAPGPFAFGDPGRVQGILSGAGFRAVTSRPFQGAMSVEASSLDEAAAAVARLGPVARLLVDRDAADVARAVAAIREVLPPHVSPGGRVSLAAGAWVWTGESAG